MSPIYTRVMMNGLPIAFHSQSEFVILSGKKELRPRLKVVGSLSKALMAFETTRVAKESRKAIKLDGRILKLA